jgi:hypothetical protein
MIKQKRLYLDLLERDPESLVRLLLKRDKQIAELDQKSNTLYFDFNMVTESDIFRNRWKEAVKADLIRDLTRSDLSEIPDPDSIHQNDYIHVVQKSQTWLYLRGQANGTASSVGKYLRNEMPFPKVPELNQHWVDRLENVPFQKTDLTNAHMGWGVANEDIALLSFASQIGLCVNQVGTIRVPFRYINDLFQDYFPNAPAYPYKIDQEHLLISPDGLVAKPEQQSEYYHLSPRLVGMLEIKCMSPFHHLLSDRGNLEWATNFAKRMWKETSHIPFVYQVQMSLQALSGRYFLNMTDSDTMYFVRWAPYGFSQFEFRFGDLFRAGAVASALYFRMYRRLLDDPDQPAYPLPLEEKRLEKMMITAFQKVKANSRYKYFPVTGYEMFKNYHSVTKDYEFTLPPGFDSNDLAPNMGGPEAETEATGVCLLD